MPIVRILVSKVDTRILVSMGFFVFSICCLVWSRLTLQISPWSLTLRIVISGLSLSMVSVPLSTTVFGALKREEVGNGSGLYNLMRNIGGIVGISAVETLLARRAQLHQTELVQNLAPSTQSYQQNVDALTNLFTELSNHAVAQQQAIELVGVEVRSRCSSDRISTIFDTWRQPASAACRWSGS